MADELIKLRLPNGKIIERMPHIARLFIKAGAIELHPVKKPPEILTKTKPRIKIPPPIKLREEPIISKPNEYPGGDEIKKTEPAKSETIKTTAKKTTAKKTAKKKPVNKTVKK